MSKEVIMERRTWRSIKEIRQLIDDEHISSKVESIGKPQVCKIGHCIIRGNPFLQTQNGYGCKGCRRIRITIEEVKNVRP